MSDAEPASRPNNLPIVEPGTGGDRGEGTRAVHPPRPDPPAQPPVGLPIYRTVDVRVRDRTRTTPTCSATASPATPTAASTTPPPTRSRSASPRSRRTASTAPVAAQAFASGMAAISTVLLRCARAGAHVVAPAAVYGGTYGLLRPRARRGSASRRRSSTCTDLDAVRAAIRAGHRRGLGRDDRQPDDRGRRPARPRGGLPRRPACRSSSTPRSRSPAVCRPLE